MALTYNPKVFEGDHVQEILSEVLEANNTVNKNLVRVMDDIKNEINVTTISGDVEYIPYQAKIREEDIDNLVGDGPTLEDSKIKPVKMMALILFTLEDLRFTRFSKDMASGAANVGSNEFEQTVLNWGIPRLGKAFERKYWNGITAATKTAIAAATFAVNSTRIKAWAAAQTAGDVDGILARLILNRINNSVNTTIHVAGTTITASSIHTEYGKVFAEIPAEVFNTGEASIIAPHSHKQLILQANQNQTYRDIFTVVGDSFKYLGVPIEFVPLPENCMVAGRAGAAGDLILGTDRLSDTDTLEINKVNNMGDEIFMKQVCTLDSAVVIASQKVLYI